MLHERPGTGSPAPWNHLDIDDRRILARLSVFQGEFAAEAAAAVLGGSEEQAGAVLVDLHERSLLHRQDAFFRLDEGLQQQAREILDPADRADARRRHARHYLEVGAAWARAVDRCADPLSVECLEREGANLIVIYEAALRRAGIMPGAINDGFRAVLALEPLYVVQRHPDPLLRMLDRCLEAMAPSRVQPELVTRALVARGKTRLFLGRPAGALADLRQAAGLASALHDPALEFRAQLELSRAHRHQGHHRHAEVACERAFALAQKSDDDFLVGRAWLLRALLARGRAEERAAEQACWRAMEHQERCGDRRGRGVALSIIGELQAGRGAHQVARSHLQEALACFEALHDAANAAGVLLTLGALFQDLGHLDEGHAAYERAHRLATGVGRRQLASRIDLLRAGLAFERGDFERARAVLEGSLATLRTLGDELGEARGLLLLACVQVELGDCAAAEAALGDAERLLRPMGPAGARRVAAGQGWVVLGQARDHERGGRRTTAARLRQDAAQLLERGTASYAGPAERLVVRLLARALAEEQKLAAGA